MADLFSLMGNTGDLNISCDKVWIGKYLSMNIRIKYNYIYKFAHEIYTVKFSQKHDCLCPHSENTFLPYIWQGMDVVFLLFACLHVSVGHSVPGA